MKSTSVSLDDKYCYWRSLCEIPTQPSLIKVKEEIDWYLIHCLSGEIGIVHRSLVYPNHYLLAEMKAENGFTFTEGCKIEVCREF